MASRITCLFVTIAALMAAVCCFSSMLESEAFVSQPQRLRSQQSETALRGERSPGRDRVATDLDEQYGKPPPTETPQFATSNVLFNLASVVAVVFLGFFIFDIGATKMEYASYND